MRAPARLVGLLAALLPGLALPGCEGTTAPPAPVLDATSEHPSDAPQTDQPQADTTSGDVPLVDSRGDDSAFPDSSTLDTGALDSAPSDTGVGDTGRLDATPSDTGVPDTGTPDTGAPDTGAPDSGVPSIDCVREVASVTEGVGTINPGSALPSSLVAVGEGACPVMLDGNRAAYVALAESGAGRVLAWGHESLLYGASEADDRGRLALNAVRWASRGRASVVVGMETDQPALRTLLTSNGFTVRVTPLGALSTVQVWITDAYRARSSGDVSTITAWVRAGGGLLVGGHGWYWASSHEGSAEALPGNLVLGHFGIAVTPDGEVQNGRALATLSPTPLDHSLRALEAAGAHLTGGPTLTLSEQSVASRAVRRALRALPIGSEYFRRVRAVRATMPDVVPTERAPVLPPTQPLAALTVAIDVSLAQRLPPEELTAHPSVADFPGAVPAGAEPVTRTLEIDGTYAGRTARLGGSNERPVWRSLGLYVPAGAQVSVTVPTTATAGGLSLLVGSWTDDNSSLDRWTRLPALTRSYPVTTTETRVASAFGGLLHVRVAPGTSLGRLSVTVTGAVPSPRFVLGVTTPTEWRATLRAHPGPWAELETSKLVLTVPSSTVRTLDDPTAILTFWDRLLDDYADLAALPRERPRAERIVFDRQIVAGYMHAGYPIMAFVPQAVEALDVATLSRSGNWGFFHELGHNHQFADWSWSGTGEATVNLWSVHGMERTVGLAPRSGHPAITASERAARVTAYLAGGRRFSADWSVWTALETFLQLQEAFGWTLFTRLNREYLALPDASRPRNEAERIQLWIVRSSEAAGRNLAPFYEAWGFPITDATRTATGALPPWAEDPMRGR